MGKKISYQKIVSNENSAVVQQFDQFENSNEAFLILRNWRFGNSMAQPFGKHRLPINKSLQTNKPTKVKQIFPLLKKANKRLFQYLSTFQQSCQLLCQKFQQITKQKLKKPSNQSLVRYLWSIRLILPKFNTNAENIRVVIFSAFSDEYHQQTFKRIRKIVLQQKIKKRDFINRVWKLGYPSSDSELNRFDLLSKCQQSIDFLQIEKELNSIVVRKRSTLDID